MRKKYEEALEVERIGKSLLKKFPELDASEARIKYLFLIAKRDPGYLGKCSKADGKWKFLTNFDFVIEALKSFWEKVDRREKESLVLHELLHIRKGIEKRTNKIKWVIRKHDLEEFNNVIKLHGCWTQELRDFYRYLKNYYKNKKERK